MSSQSSVHHINHGNDTVHSLTYDNSDRVISEAYNGTTATTYSYNTEGYLGKTVEHGLGVTTYYGYDLVGRVTDVDSSDGVSSDFIYNEQNSIDCPKINRKEQLNSILSCFFVYLHFIIFLDNKLQAKYNNGIIFSRKENENLSDFNRIWEECQQSIYKLCNIKLSSFPDAADEVFSDVYSAFSTAIKKGTHITYPKAWLYKTANNLIAKKYKELKEQRNRYDISDTVIEAKISLPIVPDITDTLITEKEIEEMADNILATCTEEERQLLNMFYIQKKSYKEIAVIFEKSENAVKQQNYRLSKRIKKLVIKEFN